MSINKIFKTNCLLLEIRYKNQNGIKLIILLLTNIDTIQIYNPIYVVQTDTSR